MTRVLIVDDDPLFRELARYHLTAGGFEVVGEAADAEEALALARERTPDVVLLDLRLGADSGLRVLERLRDTLVVRIVLVSGEDADHVARLALTAGADAFVPKHVLTGERLAAAVTG